MRIDCDTHYWPIDFLERVDHPGRGRIEREDETTVSFYRAGELVHRFHNTRWDLGLRKAAMDKEGFDRQVLIPDNRPFLYELGHVLGRSMASAFNDYAAEAVKNEPRFIGVSWVFLPDMEEAIREMERAAGLGLRAVKLNGAFADGDLDDHAMWPFYEAAEALDVPLLVHPAARAFEDQTGHPWLIGADRYAGMRFLASTLGFPFTYMHTITRLIYGGVLDRFPKLRLAFFEGGAGWVPFLRNQLDREAEHRSFRSYLTKAGIKLKRKPSEYFDQLYVSAIAYEPYLADTAKQWPDHRIIIGSDFDHADPIATWPTTVQRIRDIPGLAADEQDRILGGNAARLFNLPG